MLQESAEILNIQAMKNMLKNNIYRLNTEEMTQHKINNEQKILSYEYQHVYIYCAKIWLDKATLASRYKSTLCSRLIVKKQNLLDNYRPV